MEFKVIVESLSPIHIGSGKKYPLFSILDNYRYNDEEIFRRFVEENLSAKSIVGLRDIYEIMEKFEDKIYNYAKSIKNSLQPIYRIDEFDEAIGREPKIAEVDETIKYLDKTQLKPMIPGSTIKGIFLTAWLYRILKNKINNLEALLETYVEEEKEEKKRKKLKDVLSQPNLLEKYKEKIENLLGSKLPIMSFSDCLPESYKIKVGKIWVGRTRKFNLEVVDEFKGRFSMSIENELELEKTIETLKIFTSDYFKNLEGLRVIDGNIKDKVAEAEKLLENMRSNEAIIIVGKFTNMYAKSLISILPQKQKVKLPRPSRFLRYFSINERKMPIGLVKIKVEKE